MSGPSLLFVAFGVAVALLMRISSSLRWQQSVMVAASVLFLASFSSEPVDFVPFVGFVLIGYGMLRLSATPRLRSVALPVTITLVLYLWIKKYSFIPSAVWLPYTYVTIGVSYILFRLLHLIVESRTDDRIPSMTFGTYVSYLLGFNTLVAGPIQAFDDYLAQLDKRDQRVSLATVAGASERIVVGLLKTNVLAAICEQLHNSSLATIRDVRPHWAVIFDVNTFVFYTLFLYYNFSGYIDIVIGLSQLMARELPENFDRPFSALSFIDFWNRWHITLSRWLRAYVYNPMVIALARRVPGRRAAALSAISAYFVTFFLVGVWHGRTAGFLFFGLLQGFGVAANKAYQLGMQRLLGKSRYRSLASDERYRALARGLTFTWFTFTLTWFWATWSEASAVWSQLPALRWTASWIALVAMSSLALWAWEAARSHVIRPRWENLRLVDSRRLRTAWFTTMLLVVVATILLVSQAPPGIVYKNF